MSDLTSADFDRLDQLSAMLAAIPKVTAAGRDLLSAKNQKLAMERVAAAAKDEAAAAKDEAVQMRSEVAQARIAMQDAKAAAALEAEAIVADAQKRAKSLVDNAGSTVKEILLRAHDEADSAKREAGTIRATIADKRAECDRLDAKAAKIREQLKKMIGE